MYIRKGMLLKVKDKRWVLVIFGIILIAIGIIIYVIVLNNNKRLSPSFQEETLVNTAKEYMESTAVSIISQGPKGEIVYTLGDLENILSRSIKELSKCDKDKTRIFIKYIDKDNIEYRAELSCENE